jgi:hypothetical protein
VARDQYSRPHTSLDVSRINPRGEQLRQLDVAVLALRRRTNDSLSSHIEE